MFEGPRHSPAQLSCRRNFYYFNVLHMLFAERGLRSKQRVQVQIASAQPRRKGGVQAVARGVRWPPSERCWVTLSA